MERLGIAPRQSFGLSQLDLKLAKHISRRRGFFVEVGANDGISQSNTAYLERYLGWCGLLIEPIPDLARRCRLARPRALVEQCAVVPFDYPNATVEMQYCNLMSLVRGALASPEDEDNHIRAGAKYLALGEAPYAITVPARTLSSVLDSHRITSVDLLSLDVEGYEAGVLRGLDFRRHAPQYILVEANYLTDIENVLGERYVFLAQLSHHDRLYQRKGAL